MNWLDYILVFILIYNLYNGFRQGLLKQVVGLAGFFIAFYCSLRWNGVLRFYLDRYLKLDEVFVFLGEESAASLWLLDVIINIISFLMIMLFISLVLSLILQRLRLVNKVPLIGPLNALGGAAIGTIKGLLVVFLTVSILSLLQTEFWQNTMQSSAVVDLSRYYMGMLFHFIGGLVVDNLTKLV
ncbi:MAG: CvpA family protein [Bacillota bacterium]